MTADGEIWVTVDKNGSVESFNGTFRADCLDREWFANLHEARIVIEQWRWEYNTQRPHSSLWYRTPAEVVGEARAQTALRLSVEDRERITSTPENLP